MSAALEHPASTALYGGQFLTFRLEPEEYGVQILQVQEIKEWERATRVPNSPDYVEGVLNLRGLIVPVVDLRLRLGLPGRERDDRTVIIVVQIEGRLAGFTVDSVTDVIDIAPDECCPVPEYDGQTDRDFISGLARREGRLLILLEVAHLLDRRIAERSHGLP